MIKKIPVTDISGIKSGQTENKEAGTGCTVLICENGMHAGLDVRGGGPASRESQLLNPLMAAQEIHAIVLAGGSAYGLGTANGVMEYLEEKGIGFERQNPECSNGQDAIRLWAEYVATGSMEALEWLIAYNQDDVRSLWHLTLKLMCLSLESAQIDDPWRTIRSLTI